MAKQPPPLDPTAQAGEAPAPTRRLLLVVGEGLVATYPLDEHRPLVVGRDPESDIPLPHHKISRRHALVHAGPAVEVEDLGSTNGTRVAGELIPEHTRVPLGGGINLQLGPYVAVIVDGSVGATAEEPLRAAIAISDPTPTGVPDVVRRVARGAVSVLITGETGVGKEVLARTIHELSERKGQLVGINCASLSEALLESELFGHERGAFTGAARAKPGLFEVAEAGTVLLDEIGELPSALQAKLLRVLETRTIYRVGGVKAIDLDVRFLAATHRDLLDDVATGRFRRDLYFRVNGIIMDIAPLRERRDALPALAAELLARATTPGRKVRLSLPALEVLLRHDWPGNVRELRTVMERAAAVCEGEEIRAGHILLDTPREPTRPVTAEPDDERQRILAALEACAGNQTRAAKELGLSRTTLLQRLAFHRIPRPRPRRR